MPKSQSVSEFGAGASIGALLGLIMGLSVSPVVLTVLGALAAGLLALLGFSDRSNSADAAPPRGTLRVFGFGAFCTLFVVVGIIFRTHDTLAPSIADQESRLSSSGLFSKTEIHQILLLKAFGLSQSTGTKSTDGLQAVAGRSIAASSAPVLFASQAEICQVMRRDQYNNISNYVQSLKDHGGDYASLADAIANQKPEEQEQMAASLSNLLCK
ncbi:MAG: hypothetical protein ACHP8B_12945 [Terriglobales bacterium]